jgi:hypothetical protein
MNRHVCGVRGPHQIPRDLVLGSTPDGKPIRFRVTLDGQAPRANHGTDIDDQGNGLITEHRLYQLIRRKADVQKGDLTAHTFEIEFFDSGEQAFQLSPSMAIRPASR